MTVYVGTPPFKRIALWVAMETMHLNMGRIFFFLETKIWVCLRSQCKKLIAMETIPRLAR